MENLDKVIYSLVKKSKEGDKKALNELLHLYSPFVKRVVRYYSILLNKEDREDLFVEGLMALMRSVNSYDRKKGSFNDFAFITIRNAIFDYKRSKRTYLELTQVVEQNFDIEDAVLLKGEIEEFSKILTSLEKSVFELYLKGYRISEIAKKLDKSYKSVDNSLQRIKKRLKQCYKW